MPTYFLPSAEISFKDTLSRQINPCDWLLGFKRLIHKISSKVLLIDGFNLVRRLYEAHPNGDSEIDAVIDSAGKSLQRALNTHRPTHGIVVFECHDPTWRHMFYSEYKAGRKPTPPTLLDGIAGFETKFNELGIASFSLNNYEADDVIATLAVGIARAGGEAIVLSTDKSFLQLINANIHVFDHFKQSEYLKAEVVERLGVKISQLTDYWAMSGDASNNIKGVARIGKKSAAALLGKYSSLEEILASSDEDKKVQLVKADANNAIRCKQLVTLKLDVELGINLKTFRLHPKPLPDADSY